MMESAKSFDNKLILLDKIVVLADAVCARSSFISSSPTLMATLTSTLISAAAIDESIWAAASKVI